MVTIVKLDPLTLLAEKDDKKADDPCSVSVQT
jgi:hypothetical protein